MSRSADPQGDGRPAPARPDDPAAEPEPSIVWCGSLASQRSVMRALCDDLGDDPDAICSAYVEAERAGGLARARGAETMAPLFHARMLWREGTLKGWLRRG